MLMKKYMNFINNKKKFVAVIMLPLFLCITSCDLLDEFLENGSLDGGPLTEKEAVKGLKSALRIGIQNTAEQLSLKNGYYSNDLIKLYLPDDVNTALDFVDDINNGIKDNLLLSSLASIKLGSFSFDDFSDLRGKLIRSINKAAESAAPLSVDIFKSAIVNMNISDGMGILFGDSTAATDFFKTKTLNNLTDAYSPFVKEALDKVNATQIWTEFSSSYNQLLKVYKENETFDAVLDLNPQELTTKLDVYTTEKALSGLFIVVGQEESKIRKDPLARVNDILERVFGELDDRGE